MKEYEIIKHCDNCDEDTDHTMRNAEHPRDSSNDIAVCHKCGWIWSGLDGLYAAPWTDA